MSKAVGLITISDDIDLHDNNAVLSMSTGMVHDNTFSDALTVASGKNALFFGKITFNKLVTISTNSELILLKPDVDFVEGFELQGTLNWIT